jgi:hypothetical protein
MGLCPAAPGPIAPPDAATGVSLAPTLTGQIFNAHLWCRPTNANPLYCCERCGIYKFTIHNSSRDLKQQHNYFWRVNSKNGLCSSLLTGKIFHSPYWELTECRNTDSGSPFRRQPTTVIKFDLSALSSSGSAHQFNHS